MLNLSPGRPVEFMTTIAGNLAEHEQLKSPQVLQTQNLAATACSSAYLMIAAVDPDGGMNPEMFERCRLSFDEAQRYESFLGGDPIEDVVVYFSDASKMSFAENGRSVSDALGASPMNYPHYESAKGAAAKLQAAHLAFGIISKKQLAKLDNYRVIILPNVLRMDSTEIDAFRDYVAGGGRVYASAFTSLTDCAGKRFSDFAMADLFGCHYEHTEQGLMIHMQPSASLPTEAIARQRYLTHWIGEATQPAVLRLAEDPDAETLMSLSLPYGYPDKGHVEGRNWASIHSSPPWLETRHPVVVRNRYGEGEVIYSAAAIETGSSAAHTALFNHLVDSLLNSTWRIRASAADDILLTAFDQPDRRRWMLSLLDLGKETQAATREPIKLELQAPPGTGWTGLECLADSVDSSHSTAGGVLHCEFTPRSQLTMFAASYAAAD